MCLSGSRYSYCDNLFSLCLSIGFSLSIREVCVYNKPRLNPWVIPISNKGLLPSTFKYLWAWML